MIITIIIVIPLIGHLLCVDICCGIGETEYLIKMEKPGKKVRENNL